MAGFRPSFKALLGAPSLTREGTAAEGTPHVRAAGRIGPVRPRVSPFAPFV